MSTRYHLAIDIGASSGRHVIGYVEDGVIRLEEVYRFDNIQVRRNGHDCWNIDSLYESILEGLRECKRRGMVPETMGIDTWGVDFVLVDGQGALVSDAVAYRDSRTEGLPERFDAVMKPGALYRTCGIQRQSFNTIYQLMALKREHPDQLDAAARFLMVPDYFNYRLTGVMANEYTNATTTNLLNARTRDWDPAVLDAIGVDAGLFEKPLMPGTTLGGFTPEVREAVGFDCRVMLPATHDTGSAFLAVPARDDDAVYISSGTWSLLGVEHEGPITSEAARLQNFTNEGGYQVRFRFLKNIMGLWMVQSIRRELNGVDYVEGKSQRSTAIAWEGRGQVGFGDLIEAARAARGFEAYVNVNDDRFLAPASMIDEIRAACRETGQPVPATVGELMCCVYRSLAQCYANSIADLAALTGRDYTSINIVGGGCQDGFLNQITADACGLPVYAGPVEGTSLGNLIVQFIDAGDFASLQEARDAIHGSFDIGVVEPAANKQ
ncbi:MAG: rhamnulokinase [Eggerthellaceae bacterium]|nr:rhamnulokinase [Eggerthellaceae bacterium]